MINKVILLGNLGKDPDTRFTADRQGRDKILPRNVEYLDRRER